MIENKPARPISSMAAFMGLPRSFCHVRTNTGLIARVALLLGTVAASTDVAAHSDWLLPVPNRISRETQWFNDACTAALWGSTKLVRGFDFTCTNCHQTLAGGTGTLDKPLGLSVCKIENDHSELCDVTRQAVPAPSSVVDYTAMCNTPPITVTVTRSKAEWGTVTSSPPGLDCSANPCGQNFAQRTGIPTTTLMERPNQGYVVSGWTGCNRSDSTTCTINATSISVSVTANFKALLTVEKQGDGIGTIRTAGNEINCPGDCEEPYEADRTVTLMATEGTNSTFNGWTGCDSLDPPSPLQCKVTMDRFKSVTANFLPPQTLFVAMTGKGTGTVTGIEIEEAGPIPGTEISCRSGQADCSKQYKIDANVRLTATATAKSTFNGWSGIGVNCPGTGTCTVTINTSKAVKADFLPPSILTVTTVSQGTVTAAGIACPGDCVEDYPINTVVPLTASPATGYVFADWSDACTGRDSCDVRMDADKRVTATFFPKLTVVTSGEGAVAFSPVGIDCGKDCSAYLDGTTVSLAASPAPGSIFSGWSGCTVEPNEPKICKVTMAGPKNVTATFTPKLFVSTRGLGKITSTDGIDCGIHCGNTYPAGTQVTLTATPEPGYVFKRWSGACTDKGSCVVTIPDARTVTAIFEKADKESIADGRRFLLFPNPQVQPDGKYQTDTEEYAKAYYRAIDPNNDKDTLEKWKAANHFGEGGEGQACGVVGQACEVEVFFGDQHDLGSGRRMTGRQNVDGTIAFLADAFVDLSNGYTYGHNNVLAAVEGARRFANGTSAIEYSPGPGSGDTFKFLKFYNFDPVTGERRLKVDLDNRGEKAMPGLCTACHGGRADPLTPGTGSPTGKPLFPIINNALSQQRGDTQGRLHPLKVDTFDYAEIPGFARADQEAKLKELNKLVLCTYPRAASANSPEDLCRPVVGTGASQSEWMGGAAAWIKGAYGGNGLPSGTYVDEYIPGHWLSYGQSTLYREVVNSACLGCHMLRGTGNQADIDFTDFLTFGDYADSIKKHVIDRGNMPLAKVISERFRETDMANKLAVFLQKHENQTVRGRDGRFLQPGRPIALPGPDRVIKDSAVLSASESLYANAYKWRVVERPAGSAPTLDSLTSANPTFSAATAGTYKLRLIARKRSGNRSAPADLKIVVKPDLSWRPDTIRFSDIKSIFVSSDCVRCHDKKESTTLLNDGNPPISYDATEDRNGDGTTDDMDDLWFYTEVRGRINFTDIEASPLLRKPSGHHHYRPDPGGGLQPGFDTGAGDPGHERRKNYDIFLNWILNGAPYK